MDTQGTVPAVRRRWWQFGLKGLLLVVLLASVGAAWLAWECRTIRDRHAFLEEFRAAGGFVSYWTLSANKAVYPQIRWHRKLLGDQSVAGLSFRNITPEMHDRAIALFPELVLLNGEKLTAP